MTMLSALPFALFLLTLSWGSELPSTAGSTEEKATAGSRAAANDEKEPIALTQYQQARFLFGTSTNTRFVTTTTSTIVTCVSTLDDGTNPPTVCKKRKKRAIKLEEAAKEDLIDSSLLELEDGASQNGRLLFSAATVFTTLTFTQVVDNTAAATVKVSLSCVPPGNLNLCLE